MKKYIVRYGAMRWLGVVDVPDKRADGFFHGTTVIVKTTRGTEAATILCETNDEKIAKIPNLVPEQPCFIRKATPEDDARTLAIKADEQKDFDRCLRIVDRMRVELTLVRVEQIVGHDRVVVYYVADGRVDFRELVRALAAEFQTRIEMKQIGVRDETKLLADVGDCGREVCCNTYLAAMPPVSMKMAKLQKATLDPTKVSGRCGRLKCCLRYEYDHYRQLNEEAPAIGSDVETPNGPGRVFAQELFAKSVVVEFAEGGRQSFKLEELKYTIERCGEEFDEEAEFEESAEEPAQQSSSERFHGRTDARSRNHERPAARPDARPDERAERKERPEREERGPRRPGGRGRRDRRNDRRDDDAK